MRLSSLNIFSSYAKRREQQKLEVEQNSNHPKIVWNMDEHNSWGNNIEFFDYETRRIMGHLTPLPKIGDKLIAKMISGRKFKFEFIKVEPCIDPSDMFFATVKDIGYID